MKRFTEAYGLQGQNRVYEVIQNILKYHQHDKANRTRTNAESFNSNNIVSPSKVTLSLTENGITIIDNTVVSQKKIFKKPNQQIVSKSYSITYDNITYVCRLTNQPYSDIVTFITKSSSNLENKNVVSDKASLYLHAFRCDSDETAVKMERYLTQYLRVYWKKVEKQQSKQRKSFVEKQNKERSESPSETSHLYNSNLKNSFLNRQALRGQKLTYDNSSGGGTNSSSSNDLLNSTNDSSMTGNMNYSIPSPVLQYSINNPIQSSSRPTSPLYMNKPIDFENINKEITFKLNSNEPILYPPKDYTEEDRLRGNLEEARSRRSQNPSIVGREALKIKTKSITNLDEAPLNEANEDMQTNSDFTSASFNEQANQVLKLLDDVVDSEIASPDYELMTNYEANNNYEVNTNIYEFQPPKITSDFIPENKVLEPNVGYRSASFRSVMGTNFNNMGNNMSNNMKHYSNVSASMEDLYQNTNNFGNLNQRSTSVAGGLNDPYFNLNQNGLIKQNPLHMIEEENFYNSNNNNSNHLINSNVKNSPYARENEYSPNMSPVGLVKNSDSKKSKSSSSTNLKIFGQSKNSKNSKTSVKNNNDSSSSGKSQPTAANIGFRAGVWPILSNYHPQWLSTTALNENPSNTEFIVPKNQYLGSNLDKHTSFKDVAVKNAKLKYSESAKVNNRDYNQQMQQKQIEQMSNITKGISFLKKGLSRVNEDEYLNVENSEFILRPAMYANSSNTNEGKFLDAVPSSNLITSNQYIKPSKAKNSLYRSEPSLANISNKINNNDIYY